MCHSLLNDVNFHNSLFVLDQLIAKEIKQKNCPLCNGSLHQANYQRKPLGVPQGTHSDFSLRFSFCCAKEGCRTRYTPPSMRFLSRKQYSSTIIILFFLLSSPSIESKIDQLAQLTGVLLPVDTVRRWRHFWQSVVTQSRTWKRTAFSQDLANDLPASLLNKFTESLDRQLKLALRWILPLTTGSNYFDIPITIAIPI